MGKTALFAIAAFTVMGAVYGLSTSGGMLATTGAIADHDYEILARNAAVSGYEAMKMELAESFASGNLSGSYESANYNVSATVAGTSAKVTSVGLAFLPQGGTKTFTIVAQLEQEISYNQSDEVPPFMQYALISEDNLTLGGNMTVDTLRAVGMDDANYNANVHTNGQLSTNGKAADIRGFGTYKTTENVKHKSVFKPYYNPAGDPVVRHVPEGIPIPAAEFDIPTIVANAASIGGVDSTSSADVTLSGTYDFEAMGATRENPFIWVINGDLSGTGNVQVKGYVMFLVDGDASFAGNMQQGVGGSESENMTALYVSGDLAIAGTADFLYAQIFVKDDVSIHGTAGIYGNIVAGDQATISGTPTIKYFPASPALTTIWQEPETRLRLLSYREY